MNLLFSCIGRRNYVANYFRAALQSSDRIYGTSSTPWTPGFLACDKTFILPPYRSAEYRQRMIDLCEAEKVDAVFSLMDEDVDILSSFADELRAVGTVPVLPPKRIAELCLDKWKAYNFFVEAGIPTALTFKGLEAATLALKSGELAYPLFLKPRFGFGSAHNFVVRNEKELHVLFAYQKDMLIQETLEGECYNVDLLADLSGRAVSIVPWRKFVSRLGETEQAQTVDFPELIAVAEKVVTALDGHVGPMDIDFFVSNGTISILELNPRFGGGYPVSQLAGANFPSLIVRMLRGETVEPSIGQYERGVIMMKELVPFGGPEEAVRERKLKIAPAEPVES